MKTCTKHHVHFPDHEHCLSCGPEPKPAFDAVNRPEHYASGSIECIDAIAAAMGDEGAAAFCRGNAIKYLWRGGKKDAVEQDLRKAIWYIEREIKIRNTGVGR